MAPTIQNQGKRTDGTNRSRGSVDRSSGLVTRVKYCNTLPDIPFDPKFIRYPFDANRFVEYKPTSLEKQHKTELHTDHGLGVIIDLINPDTYKTDPNFMIDPADEALLQEDLPAPQDSKRSKLHSMNVSWQRRSEYISQEFNRYGVKSSNVETRIGAGLKDLFKQDDLYKDRDGQLQAIEKTFQDAKSEITQHYSKAGVYPVASFPVYPDMKMWQHPSAQVIFDTDPALPGKPAADQMEEMSQAMIRGMVDEEGDQFVAYFLPTEETRKKRKRDVEEEMDYSPEETYDYKLAREYNWNVKNKASKGYEENYYFVFREDGVFYNELETRVRLSKRRARGGGGIQSATNAVLAVKHREMHEQELAAQEMRRIQLEPLEPDDEEEEEEEADENANADEEQKSDNEEQEGEEQNVGEDDEQEENQGGEEVAKDSDGEVSQSEGEEMEHDGVEEEEETQQQQEEEDESDADDGEKAASSDDEEEGAGGATPENKDEEEIFGSASDSDEESS